MYSWIYFLTSLYVFPLPSMDYGTFEMYQEPYATILWKSEYAKGHSL